MKNIYRNSLVLILSFLLTTFNWGYSQCGVGGITITRQGQIDSFPINYPGCHRILGDLIIANTDIVNLEGLSQLDSVDSYFNLSENYNLMSLEGLRNLQYVESFYINNDTLLTNLNGLRNLRNASNSLNMTNLPKLVNLQGLNRIKNIRQLSVYDCDGLVNFSGLDSLENVNSIFVAENEKLDSLLGFVLLNPRGVDHFIINSCPRLRSLIPLPKLQVIYNLNLSNNQNLRNLNGLDSIRRIYFMQLSDNPNLVDITSLSQMNYIDYYLRLMNNSKLKDISSLRNVNLVDLDSLVLIDNDSLSYCHYPNICNYLTNPLNVTRISNNLMNCNTRSEVESFCLTLPLDIISFEGMYDNGKVQLDWISVNEHNHKSIGIERRVQNGAWELLQANVQASKREAGKNYYSFEDLLPGSVINYYRLNLVDKNGQTDYSKVISINVINTGTTNYTIQQNENGVQFNFESMLKDFTLVDQYGRITRYSNLHNKQLELNENSIFPGLYFYVAQLENEATIQGKLFIGISK